MNSEDVRQAIASLGADPAWVEDGLVAPETVLRDAAECARVKDIDLVRYRIRWLRDALLRGDAVPKLPALFTLALKEAGDGRCQPLRMQMASHAAADEALLDRVRREDPSPTVRAEARASLFRRRLARLPWKGALIRGAELKDGDVRLTIEDADGAPRTARFISVARAHLVPCECIVADWRVESGGKWVDTIRAEWPRLFGGKADDPWMVFTARMERWGPELVVVAKDVEA